MTTEAAAEQQTPSMDPSPDSQQPSGPVDAEVIEPPAPSVAAVAPIDGPPVATGPTEAMTRSQYRALADRLILEKDLWVQFYNRCQAFAHVGMYGHKQAETVAAAALKGMSLGMSFMEALDRIKVIHGTPVIRGPAAINHIHERCKDAKCRAVTERVTRPVPLGVGGVDRDELVEYLRRAHPDCWTDGDVLDPDKISVWLMERPGWETGVYIFTWAKAESSGLVQKNENYKKYPARCLKWQAASEGAQEMFGDVLGGLYFAEELESTPTDRRQSPPSNYEPPKRDEPTRPEEAPESQADQKPADEKPADQKPADPEITKDHPQVARLHENIDKVAKARNAPADKLAEIKKTIYNEAKARAGLQLEGRQPSVAELEKLNAYLEAQLKE